GIAQERGKFAGVCVVPELRKETVCAGRLQQQDESLKELFEKATEVEGVSTGRAKALAGEYYFVCGSLLYHQPEGDSTEQLVVPCSLSQGSCTPTVVLQSRDSPGDFN
uniref:Uncharacterized protein n=1 Tax=Gadus morhua TaxID=8049 RepID=A0A8C5A763_GADMO